MHSETIAIDRARHVFEVAVSAQRGKISERRRMSRPQFERFRSLREPCRVVMEACGSAHFWAHRLLSVGNIHAIKSGRYLASWLGPTPKESSSGTPVRPGVG